jgi:hypothetical protein
MRGCIRRRDLVSAILGLSVAGCTRIGPGTVSHDRIDYATAIGNSWKEQTLLNIVKLRYADMPIFLAVDQVIAGYQLQSAVGGSFTAGNFNATLVGPFTASGSATAAGTYTDRPTVIYSPLIGVDFLKRLMTPVRPSSLLFLLQSGYSAARIMPIMLESINGLNNGSSRLRRLVDPKFTRLVELMQEGQLAGAIQIRIEPSKSGAESSVLVFGPSKDPELAARGREIKNLLGIRPDLRELKVNYGGYSGRDDEIDMMTRSMLQIMLEFAAVVQVPRSDLEQGKAAPGLIDTRAPAAPGGPPLQILVTDTPPKDAFVAVQYRERWFWIADADFESKYTFGIIMLLFSIADTGVKSVAPVVTVPVNQ